MLFRSRRGGKVAEKLITQSAARPGARCREHRRVSKCRTLSCGTSSRSCFGARWGEEWQCHQSRDRTECNRREMDLHGWEKPTARTLATLHISVNSFVPSGRGASSGRLRLPARGRWLGALADRQHRPDRCAAKTSQFQQPGRRGNPQPTLGQMHFWHNRGHEGNQAPEFPANTRGAGTVRPK